MTSPCLGCPDRKLLCHSICERYLAFDAGRKAFLKAQFERKKIEEAIGQNARERARRKVHEQFQKKGLH